MYGSLSGSLRDFVGARNLVTSNIRLMFGVRISPLLGGQSTIRLLSLPPA